MNQKYVEMEADKLVVTEMTSVQLESDKAMPEELEAEEADLGTSHLDRAEISC